MIDTELPLFIQMDHLLFWLGISTESANLVPGISHTVRYKNSSNQTGDPAWFSVVVVIPFEPKQQSPCWVFTAKFLRLILILE